MLQLKEHRSVLTLRLESMLCQTLRKAMTKPLQLLDIRLGPGAMVMKPEVKRIHMKFAKTINDGHMGPRYIWSALVWKRLLITVRKFWHNMLPRLKFHNSAIPMTVTRTDDNAGPAVLSVFFSRPGEASPDPSQQVEEQEERIDMKHKTDTDILNELTTLTEAKQIEPTEQEEADMTTLEEQAARSARDAQVQQEVVEKKKREAQILETARRSATMQSG